MFLPNWYIIGTFLAPFCPSKGSQEDLAAKITPKTIAFAVVAIILLNDVNENGKSKLCRGLFYLDSIQTSLNS